MRSGDRPSLQNRRAAGLPVAGGFDPHSLPPHFMPIIADFTCFCASFRARLKHAKESGCHGLRQTQRRMPARGQAFLPWLRLSEVVAVLGRCLPLRSFSQGQAASVCGWGSELGTS